MQLTSKTNQSILKSENQKETELMQGANYQSFSPNRFENYFDTRESSNDSALLFYPQSYSSARRMAVISEIEEHENQIVEEFCLLLDKSRQLFNGLRYRRIFL